MTIDPAHQRFIDDAALGAKVREFVWDKEPIAPLIRCKRLELEVAALKGDIAALTAERDALVAAMRQLATTMSECGLPNASKEITAVLAANRGAQP